MSQYSGSRIRRAFGLAPHRCETFQFQLSTDPQIVDKVRDVVGLYLNRPDRALVCVDEKPSVQATQGTAPLMPMPTGETEHHKHDDVRHGTAELFAALDILAGMVIGKVGRRHRSIDFRHFLNTIEQSTPPELDLHRVRDNSSIHKTLLVHLWQLRHPRVHLQFTPTSASWLSLVECWFSLLNARRLKRGQSQSVRSLECAIRSYIAGSNIHPHPFVWHKTADEILTSIASFCQRTHDSHH